MIAPILLGAALSLGTPPAPATQPETRPATSPAAPVDPDERLWAEIVALRANPPETDAFETWVALAESRRVELVAKLNAYLSLYPGGENQDHAVAWRLTALYELGSLRGGDFAAFCEQVRVDLAHYPPDSTPAAEAAFWKILCEHLARAPEMAPQAAAQARDDSYRAYIAAYPDSRHTPALAASLFRAAEARHDRVEMRALAALLQKHRPDHLITSQLAGTLRRLATVGQPFHFTGKRLDGQILDTRRLVGRPVFLVLWTATQQSAVDLVRAVEQARRENPELVVVGLHLRQTGPAYDDVIRALELDWPQVVLPLGLADDFPRAWGVDRIPVLFALDRAGRLVGMGGRAALPGLLEPAAAPLPVEPDEVSAPSAGHGAG